MDVMNIVQLVLIVFLLLITRYLSWKANRATKCYENAASMHNKLADKYNHLVDDYNSGKKAYLELQAGIAKACDKG